MHGRRFHEPRRVALENTCGLIRSREDPFRREGRPYDPPIASAGSSAARVERRAIASSRTITRSQSIAMTWELAPWMTGSGIPSRRSVSESELGCSRRLSRRRKLRIRRCTYRRLMASLGARVSGDVEKFARAFPERRLYSNDFPRRRVHRPAGPLSGSEVDRSSENEDNGTITLSYVFAQPHRAYWLLQSQDSCSSTNKPEAGRIFVTMPGNTPSPRSYPSTSSVLPGPAGEHGDEEVLG